MSGKPAANIILPKPALNPDHAAVAGYDGQNREVLEDMLNIKMTYGHITGSERLRQLISEQYSKQSSENILITHGAIGANA